MDFNPDEGLDDDGWFAGGSIGLFKALHIVAEYDDIGNYTLWNAGIGWHGLFGDPGDLYVQAVWNDVDLDIESDLGESDISDNGYEIDAGIRWKVLKWLELKGQATWTDYDEAGSDVGGEVGALFTFLDDKLGFGVEYAVVNDADQARGYFRWNLGR